VLGLAAMSGGLATPQRLTSYVVAGVLGWLLALVLGVSYRVLPTLTWHYRFAARAGRPETPALPAMVQARFGWLALALHGSGTLLLVTALLWALPGLSRAGALLLLVAVLVTLAHHVRMLLVGRSPKVPIPGDQH